MVTNHAIHLYVSLSTFVQINNESSKGNHAIHLYVSLFTFVQINNKSSSLPVDRKYKKGQTTIIPVAFLDDPSRL
jgi:hypothetical protein